MTWYRTKDEVRAFLALKGKERRGPHSPKMRRGIPWPVCSHCGLVWLKNDLTRAAIKAVCVTIED